MEVNASTNKVGGAGNVELKCRVQIVRKQLQVLSLPHLVSDVGRCLFPTGGHIELCGVVVSSFATFSKSRSLLTSFQSVH